MVLLKSKTALGILLSCTITLAANYYMQDFFPIGFTGFNFTHHWTDQGTPYPDNDPTTYPYGTWYKERELLDSTHCNFIGCSDADKDICVHKCAIDKNISYNILFLNN